MLLFTPGPTPVPESIRLAMAEPTLHHRTPEFEAIFASVRQNLKTILNMHEVLMLASSGSGAMEACVRTFARKGICVINCGKFGERFTKIAAAYNIPCNEIRHEWDTPASVDEVVDKFKKDITLDAIAMQMCESAGGLRHPVEEVAKALKELARQQGREILVIVDAITAMGVEEIDTTHIDALIGGSQKAFMLPPGLSVIGLSQRAVEVANERDIGFYFNIKTELKNQVKNTTAWTAPTTIVQGLGKYFELVGEIGASSLKNLEKVESKNPNMDDKSAILLAGMREIYERTQARAIAMNEAFRALGLRIYPKAPAHSMSTIFDKTNAANIRKMLKKYGVNAAGGQDHLKTSIIRFNHMGLLDVSETAWAVNALELALDELGLRYFDGTGNRVFLQKYYGLLGILKNARD